MISERPGGVMRFYSLVIMVLLLSAPLGAEAGAHYFSLKNIFPEGKCSPVIPNFESMKQGFTGGEIVQFKIHDGQGELIEILTSFISKNRDQWALVGSKTETKVIFCLYASGIGRDSVNSQIIK